MNTPPDDNEKKVAQLRETEVERLNALPQFPSKLPVEDRGVLLSDRIKYYCDNFQLIYPFDPFKHPFDPKGLLRPAGYDLTVGSNYSIRGHPYALNENTQPLKIEPYDVAIIETYETLNMPEYLIGRWNVRVSLAYKGLLWVGGAQVDPGFRGHLCCPIYNLSTEAVTLKFRQPLAMIDFVTTTPYREGESRRFDWRERKMLVFQNYPPLSSGVRDRVDKFEKAIDRNKSDTETKLSEAKLSTQTRIDNFVTLTFLVLSVMFAGLTIVATKSANESYSLNPPVWLAALAFWFALRAQPGFRREGTTKQRR